MILIPKEPQAAAPTTASQAQVQMFACPSCGAQIEARFATGG